MITKRKKKKKINKTKGRKKKSRVSKKDFKSMSIIFGKNLTQPILISHLLQS